jgi:hypothetical protein
VRWLLRGVARCLRSSIPQPKRDDVALSLGQCRDAPLIDQWISIDQQLSRRSPQAQSPRAFV